jgi:hypothetical protein
MPPAPRPADKAVADKAAADKAASDKAASDKARPVDNLAQDPNHPMNKTPATDTRPAAERDRIDGPVYSSENLRTEQEKDAGNKSLGVGPLTRTEPPPPAETIEDLGIGPRTPYPTGNPPPPSESIVYGQGIKGVTDKPVVKPGETKTPAAPAHQETQR